MSWFGTTKLFVVAMGKLWGGTHVRDITVTLSQHLVLPQSACRNSFATYQRF